MSELEFEVVKGLRVLDFTFTHAELGRGSAASTSSRGPPRLRRGGGGGGDGRVGCSSTRCWSAGEPGPRRLPQQLPARTSSSATTRARRPRRLPSLLRLARTPAH
ncbi:unnamed protein product [Urochloa humidicola]